MIIVGPFHLSCSISILLPCLYYILKIFTQSQLEFSSFAGKIMQVLLFMIPVAGDLRSMSRTPSSNTRIRKKKKEKY